MDKHDEQFETFLRQFKLRRPNPVPEMASFKRRRSMRWVVAAAAALVFVVALSALFIRNSGRSGGPLATVEIAGNPSLYKVGQVIEAGTAVRSNSAEGMTLSLEDGSRVELRAQSELALESAADGIRVRLNDGSILVKAAKQGSGHLYVQTKDAMVSVVGTVFFVSAKQAGTQVGVVEGEVHVQHGSALNKLLPGEQVATNSSIQLKPVAEEIAWSRSAAEYIVVMSPKTGEILSLTAVPASTAQDGAAPSMAVLPFKVQVSYIKGEYEQVRTLITVQLNSRDLAFQDANGRKVAHVSISGGLYPVDNRQVKPISTSMTIRESQDEAIFFQEIQFLEPGQYKLQLIIQDTSSQSVGMQTTLVRVPRLSDPILQASSMILAYSSTDLTPSMVAFPLGDFRVRPSASGEFRQSQSLNVWQEFYGLTVDQTTRKTSATYEIVISQNKQVIKKLDSASWQLAWSGQQNTLTATVPLADFVPGPYDVQITVTDNLAKRTLVTTGKFSVVAVTSQQQRSPAPPLESSGKNIFDRTCTTCHSAEVAMRLSALEPQFSISDQELLARKQALAKMLENLLKQGLKPSYPDVMALQSRIAELDRQEAATLNSYSTFVLRHLKDFGGTVSGAELPTLVRYIFESAGNQR